MIGIGIGIPRGGGGLGPESLANGDFGAGATGWNVSGADGTHIATFSGGTLRYQSDTTTPTLIVSQAVPPLTIGKTYLITIVVSAWVSGAVRIGEFATLVAGAVGTFQLTGVAASASFSITRNVANVDLTIDSVSAKEVLA